MAVRAVTLEARLREREARCLRPSWQLLVSKLVADALEAAELHGVGVPGFPAREIRRDSGCDGRIVEDGGVAALAVGSEEVVADVLEDLDAEFGGEVEVSDTFRFRVASASLPR